MCEEGIEYKVRTLVNHVDLCAEHQDGLGAKKERASCKKLRSTLATTNS